MPTAPRQYQAEVSVEGPAAVAIRAFADADEDAVVALWQSCGLTRPWNDPHRDIERKQAVQRELFLVAEADQMRVVGSVMGGYDELEARLLALGCPKLNLQVRAGNDAANRVYESLGYQRDEVVCFGRRLIPD